MDESENNLSAVE